MEGGAAGGAAGAGGTASYWSGGAGVIGTMGALGTGAKVAGAPPVWEAGADARPAGVVAGLTPHWDSRRFISSTVGLEMVWLLDLESPPQEASPRAVSMALAIRGSFQFIVQ
jgi:hypothetical protein